MTRATLALAVVAVAALAGCGIPTETEDGIPLPPVGQGFDYQLGQAYVTPSGVALIARDSTEEPDPDPGVYTICYVNGFQTQPGESAAWLADHPHLVLRDDAGRPVADPNWPDEYLLDTTTPENRAELEDLIGEVIAGCARDGFDAVEFDNLDTFARSDGRISIEDNIALATAYTRIAHESLLAAGQKNAAEHSERLREEVGFDFVVSEECAVFDECRLYTEVYGPFVFDIEYDGAKLLPACTVVPTVVLRDRLLVAPSSKQYNFGQCPSD